MKKEIKTMKQALEFCQRMDYTCEDKVNIKHQIFFPDSQEPYNFSSDEDLIEWCEGDRQAIERCGNEF